MWRMAMFMATGFFRKSDIDRSPISIADGEPHTTIDAKNKESWWAIEMSSKFRQSIKSHKIGMRIRLS